MGFIVLLVSYFTVILLMSSFRVSFLGGLSLWLALCCPTARSKKVLGSIPGWGRTFLGEVCVFFECLRRFPAGAPASSQSPKTCRLIGDSKLPVGVNVSVNTSALWWTGDMSRTGDLAGVYPAFAKCHSTPPHPLPPATLQEYLQIMNKWMNIM